ncbi:MAG: hypothetical protein M3R36_06315 [Bacteroidota bacterium]|nr:hypothetical protein [Bacteroidota bacterium]
MLKIRFVFIYIGLILISSVAIISCSDDNIVTPLSVDSSDFRYPFTDGSSWNYTITISASDIRPDSIRHYFAAYPLVKTGTAKILYDTIINSVATKCFVDEYIDNGFSNSNRYYYINNDTALILYARRQNGLGNGGMLPLRKIINDLIDSYDKLNKIAGNELEVLDTLYSTLNYPMESGREWSYTLNGTTTNKKYLGFENIIGPLGTISCMKENVVYSYAPSWLNNYFYSKYGLIKTYTFINDLVHTSITNPDGDGTFDITEETIVTSFNIPSQ